MRWRVLNQHRQIVTWDNVVLVLFMSCGIDMLMVAHRLIGLPVAGIDLATNRLTLRIRVNYR
mgnify:CR=1 FL=1